MQLYIIQIAIHIYHSNCKYNIFHIQINFSSMHTMYFATKIQIVIHNYIAIVNFHSN
jgi:hypothetical protein